jgi:glycosyltransferase involved in cell wall biosynthesis
MMRIAFLTLDRFPKARGRAGGDLRLWQDLASLVKLGHQVDLITISPDAEIEPAVRELAASVTTIPRQIPRKYSPGWWLTRAFNPETLMLRFPDAHGVKNQVTRALERARPDLVWAEEQLTAVFVPPHMPYVLTHVDFFFRLMNLRATFRKLRRPNPMTNTQLERFEYELARRARVTLVASETDGELFRKRGIPARYIPVVGATMPPPDPTQFSSGRFFLFGKANTAMRAMRQHFRTVVWPQLDRELQQHWHQVGDPPRSVGDDPSWTWLTERFHVHGFVDDLAALFQLGDASVMPYPVDASGHAKYAVGMGYGMVNIGYQAAYRSTPELVHDRNCIAVETTDELVEGLRRFRADTKLRRRLAEASRGTYEQLFSFEAQLPKFAALLAEATGELSRTAARR